ncbi:hypothetical protein PC1_013 [Pseudomonas phage PC1]
MKLTACLTNSAHSDLALYLPKSEHDTLARAAGVSRLSVSPIPPSMVCDPEPPTNGISLYLRVVPPGEPRRGPYPVGTFGPHRAAVPDELRAKFRWGRVKHAHLNLRETSKAEAEVALIQGRILRFWVPEENINAVRTRQRRQTASPDQARPKAAGVPPIRETATDRPALLLLSFGGKELEFNLTLGEAFDLAVELTAKGYRETK